MDENQEALEELGIADKVPEPDKTPDPEGQPDPEPTPEPEKSTGHERVDFKTASPEEIEARFNRLYGGRKRDQAAMRQMAQDMRALFDEVKTLRKGQTDRERESEISGLQARQAAAFEQGDYEEASRINSYMMKLYTDAAKPEPVAPQPMEQQQDPLSDAEKALINDWGGETKDGAFVRPWTQNGHPEFQKGLQVAKEVWEREDLTVWQRLNEIDRRMKPASRPTSPQMLSSDPNYRPQDKKDSLSPEQRTIAANMFPELSLENAIKEYQKGTKNFDGGLA